MTQLTPEQRDAIQAAGWTEAEALGFVQAVATFRDGLASRQQEAFDDILTAAGAAVDSNDVQGHLVMPIFQSAILIALLLPAVQKAR
jgi:hypothetical protein